MTIAQEVRPRVDDEQLPQSAARTEPALLSVRDLTVTFAHSGGAIEAVRGLSFDLHPGECVAIVGESGSGKSVTARALLGLAGHTARVEATRLEWRGSDLRGFGEREWRALRGRRIALVLQDALTSLDPLRRVGAEVEESIAVHRLLPRKQWRGRVTKLLGDVGIPLPERRVRQYPHELSGGLRQRALIASAISGDPDVIIADEPTTALDVTVQAQILELLASLKAEGKGLVVISHDLAVVARIADRVLVMRHGRVVEEGPTDVVLADPDHEYTHALLDAVPGASPRPLRVAPAALEGTRVLEATGLRKTYAAPGGETTVALDGVSLHLDRAEILGIVGESGSGKTTAGRVLLGLTAPDAGEIDLLGHPWGAMPEKARRALRPRIQLVSQDPLGSFDPRHTVGTIIGEALERVGVPRAERGAETAAALRRVGLEPDAARRRPSTMSGGQRQRVAIARALATRPEIIVCDEAVSALDVSIQAQVLDLLLSLRDETGVALVFISHDLGVVHYIADRVLVMKDGEVVESGDVHDIFAHPSQPYTQQLLAALPVLPPRRSHAPAERNDHAPH